MPHLTNLARPHGHRLTRAVTTTLLALGLVVTTGPASVALPDWTTARSVWENPRARQPKIVNLRYAEHARFDRVVVDVRGRRPGYWAKYVKALHYDGSGHLVHLKGKRKFALRLTPAYAHDDQGANLYDGPRKIQVDMPTLRGIAFTGDFEGQVSFGFSTSRRAPYRIFTLTDPSRVVIDFRH
jgi:hypothetical protein